MASLETIVYFEFFTIDKSKKFIRQIKGRRFF